MLCTVGILLCNIQIYDMLQRGLPISRSKTLSFNQKKNEKKVLLCFYLLYFLWRKRTYISFTLAASLKKIKPPSCSNLV